jgi:predicted DNA binding protein
LVGSYAALTLAYEHVYFTEPRETDLEELAELLDLSPSAVAGRLKRGMKLLIEETFIAHDQER